MHFKSAKFQGSFAQKFRFTSAFPVKGQTVEVPRPVGTFQVGHPAIGVAGLEPEPSVGGTVHSGGLRLAGPDLKIQHVAMN